MKNVHFEIFCGFLIEYILIVEKRIGWDHIVWHEGWNLGNCPFAQKICSEEEPRLVQEGSHGVACHVFGPGATVKPN